MVSQPPPAIASSYGSLPLPKLLDFIAGLGDPSSISHLSQQWDALGSNMTAKITDPYNSSQPNSTLAGFTNVVYPNWKGSGADAYAQQFLDLLSHGSQVATRASFTPMTREQADDQSATFARSTNAAFQALDYVKQEAASVTPMDHQSAHTGYVNSLDGLGQLQVAYAQRSPAGRQLVDQRVAAYAAAADEAKRQQLLTLLAGLDQTYNSVASSLPTKAPGGPPALHDPSIGVPANGPLPGLGPLPGTGPGGATPGVVPFSTTHGPSAQHLTTQLPAAALPAGQLPSGSLPGATSTSGATGLPTGPSPLANVHPLASTSLAGVPAGSFGGLLPDANPQTQLAGFTPPGLASGLGNASGLVPLGSLPPGTLGGLPSTGATLPGGLGALAPLPSTNALGPLTGLGPLGAAGLGPLGAAGLTAAGLRPLGTGGLGTAGLGAAGMGAVEPGGAGLGSLGAAEPGAAGLGVAGGAAGLGATARGGTVSGTAAELRPGLGAGTAAQRAAAADGAALAQEGARGGMPMMPYMPMGPMGGQRGDGADRRSWLEEDEDVWTTDTGQLAPPVIGRPA